MILFLSLDAMDSEDFSYMENSPKLRKYFKDISRVKNAESVFVTNTYVVHTSIVSGVLPYRHGIIENLEINSPDWRWFYKGIKSKTLFGAAAKAGLKTASVLWPVTAGGPIKFNMPEILPSKPGDTQIKVSLRNGSKLFQLQMFSRYKNLLDGVKQPNLDNFSARVTVDLVKSRKADLVFAHFTDVDSHKHVYGPKSLESRMAIERVADRLVPILSAADLNRDDVFIFGDHGCLPINETIDLNKKFSGFHQCGGSAFYLGNDELTDALRGAPYVKRFISEDELKSSGFDKAAKFGVEAAPGFHFAPEGNIYKGDHGYSTRNENYAPSIYALGKNIRKNILIESGSLLDICPTALEILKLPPWETDGKILKKILS